PPDDPPTGPLDPRRRIRRHPRRLHPTRRTPRPRPPPRPAPPRPRRRHPRHPRTRTPAREAAVKPLSRRQRQVIVLAANGYTNAGIARHLGIHRNTVDRHFAERSEEHTSELQSRENLVCRLLIEKKKERSTTM